MGVASDRNSGPQPLAIAVSCRGPVGPRRNHDDRMPVGGCLGPEPSGAFSAVVTSISAGAATTGRPLIIEGYLMPGTWGSPPTETRSLASEAILRTVSRLVMKR